MASHLGNEAATYPTTTTTTFHCWYGVLSVECCVSVIPDVPGPTSCQQNIIPKRLRGHQGVIFLDSSMNTILPHLSNGGIMNADWVAGLGSFMSSWMRGR